MASIPLPALAVQPPPNPVDQIGKVLQLKSMLQGQQLQQEQLVGAQQENQQRALALQDMKTIQTIAPKYVTKDESGKATGYDFDGLEQGAIAAGVRPQSLAQLQTMRKNAADTLYIQEQAQAKHLENVKAVNDGFRGHLEAIRTAPEGQKNQNYQEALQWAQQNKVDTTHLPPQIPEDNASLNPMLDQVETKLAMGSQLITEAKEKAETRKNSAQAAMDELNAQTKERFLALSPDDIGHQVDRVVPPEGPNAALNLRTKSMATFAHSQKDQEGFNSAIKMAAEQVGAIEKETNPQVQAQRVATAMAEGKARQLVEGMEKPVYAIGPDGTKQLMSASDALQSGIRTMLPVTAKEVGDDTQLINRLGDVRQKIAQYEQNIAGLGTTISTKDQGNIAALIGSGKFKVGAFGTEMPVDRLNAALEKENISGLSEPAKKLLVSYYNARESMQGYQRVLSGTGRANEQAMQLNLDALPNPGTADASYAAESLKQFKQNLQIVGQGLPKIPGIKSPEEIEQQTNASAATPKSPPAGATHIVPGKDGKNHYTNDAGTIDYGVAP
jgi:hypothetical protein